MRVYNFTATSALLLLIVPVFSRVIVDNYETTRNNLLTSELEQSLGRNIKFTSEESAANDILMKWKQEELNTSFYNPQYFNFSRHYLSYQKDIPKSKVYKIIKVMPKGAALHVHGSMMLHVDQLIEYTYEENLYACFRNGTLYLRFANSEPRIHCPLKWTLLKELRDAVEDTYKFDEELKSYFTFNKKDTMICDSDINAVWSRFDAVYHAIKSLISYRPVFEKFFYQILENFYEDGIMYIEVRSGLGNLYEINGTKHDELYKVRLSQQIVEKFKESHPDFLGIKFIVTKNRSAKEEEIRYALNLAGTIKKEMPEIFAGFDLVGQEDLGKSLRELYPILAEYKEDIDFFFHGGETNWSGMSSDENLADAILLGSKRIGHAFALMKHPTLLAVVNDKDIALEVNVVSNEVLSLVRDMRNHPLAMFLALGLPVVLSSDDPGAWSADPLSHDYFIAFLAVASQHADLRMLKQLALNSIIYSALNTKDKERLLTIFHKRWKKFIDHVNNNKF